MERPGCAFSGHELLDKVWGASATSLDRTVERATLRAIDPSADPTQNHRGHDYALREDL